jgi:dTMP kinase
MTALLKKGLLIAIEGIDGAGKTTLVKNLQYFYENKGFPCSRFKEPTDGKYGQKIRELANYGRQSVTAEDEMKLFLEDRKENRTLNLEPAIKRKEIVFLDRYYFSSIAYQGARGLDANFIKEENEKIAIRPDLVIILDCAVIVGLSRIQNFRNEIPNHFEQEDMLEKARQIFNRMEAMYIQKIDASRTENEVFMHAKSFLDTLISAYLIKNQFDLFDQSKAVYSHN